MKIMTKCFEEGSGDWRCRLASEESRAVLD
jgi:hypothetical protein